MESLSHDKDKGTAWELTQATFRAVAQLAG